LGPLAEEFKAHRLSLGLAPDAPYFNNGVTVFDRAKWQSEQLGARAMTLIADDPARYKWFDQDVLNVLLAGRFAHLSPRWNFMGDFLLLDLEHEIAPVIYHFVNRPKPWEQGYAGDPRFAEIFHRWFVNSPWPDFAASPVAIGNPLPTSRFFRRELLAYLEKQHFADKFALTHS
jgi:lipopolysaccharide biosynthesis glycosyltransferase